MNTRHVLVVDDDPAVRKLVKAALENFVVCAAASPEEAHRILETFRPGIIFLDLVMGDRSDAGLQFLKDRRLASAVVIVTGACLTDDSESELIENGAAWVCRKPISVRKMRALTRRIVELLEVEVSMVAAASQDEYATKLNNMIAKLRKARGGLDAACKESISHCEVPTREQEAVERRI